MASGHDLYPLILTFAFCTLHFAFIRPGAFVAMAFGSVSRSSMPVDPVPPQNKQPLSKGRHRKGLDTRRRGAEHIGDIECGEKE